MTSTRHIRDEGIILRKRSLLNNNIRITIFGRESGKIVLSAYGVKKITSKRLSHLETGNYIKFTYSESGSFLSLKETEMLFGHSKVKESSSKLDILYIIFFVLNKILPEAVEEREIFNITMRFLKRLNNTQEILHKDMEHYFIEILSDAGFIDNEGYLDGSKDIMVVVEQLVGKKISSG